jgi:peptidoglycan hydrolase-like amidase
MVLGVSSLVSMPSPAAAATGVTLVGHGWGHGRGMGQWGSLGYAVKFGSTSAQILDHFYGGTTAGTVASDRAVGVLLRHRTGFETAVYLESGSIVTSADAAIGGAGPRKAVFVRWEGGTNFHVWEGSGCTGPWLDRGIVSTTEVVIDPSITSDDPNTMLQLCEGAQRRIVRGQLIASAFATSLDAFQQQTINRVLVEDYLRSVVPSESPPSWANEPSRGGYGAAGMEQLKSQAVAARSYVLAGDGRWGRADTCSDIFCQVYNGYATVTSSGTTPREFATTNQAVAATAGVVRLRAGGVIARTEFSSSTGGWTAGGAFPAVEDRGDDIAANPHHNWTLTVSTAAVETAFDQRAGRDLGTYLSLSVTARNGFGDMGGRALTVVGYFTNGSQSMTGDGLRSSLGLKSDWFGLATPVWHPAVPVRTDGTLTAGPAAVAARGPWGAIDVFVRGTDGGIWSTTQSAGSWSLWKPLGAPPGGTKDEPAAVSWAHNRIDLFVRGADDRLWQRFTLDAGATWSPWLQPVGTSGVLAAGPDVTSRAPGSLDVVVTGSDGLVYQRFYGPPGWNEAWIPLAGPPSGPVAGRTSVASWGGGRLDVFARGADNRLWQRFWHGTGWSPWIQPPGTEGGTLASAPDVVSWGTGHLSVFVRGTDGGLYTTGHGSGGWSAWARLGAPHDALVGPPGATSVGLNSLDVFIRGTDNRAYRIRFGA